MIRKVLRFSVADPLAGTDPDVALDLQAIFTATYDRAGLDYALDTTAPVEPPLSEDDAAWRRGVAGHQPGRQE